MDLNEWGDEMKIQVIIDIPESGCKSCHYYGHSSYERYYQCYDEKDYCKLFDNVELKSVGGKLQRCIACQSCEVTA